MREARNIDVDRHIIEITCFQVQTTRTEGWREGSYSDCGGTLNCRARSYGIIHYNLDDFCRAVASNLSTALWRDGEKDAKVHAREGV